MVTPKEYTVRPGTIDSGKPYEIKTTALLSLKCCLKDLDDFWIASNVEECGDFDDVVLFKKEKKKNGVTYLIQLKHQDTPSQISRKNILEGKKSKDFCLKKYLDSCFKLSDAISNRNSEIIDHFKNNLAITYIIFTNKNVAEEFEFLELIKSSSDLANINGDVYKFKLEELNSLIALDDRSKEFIKNMFLYTKQPHIEKIDNKIKDVIKTLIKPINKPDKDLDEILRKFLFFVEDWYRGRLNGHYPLTKIQILKKITEILLEPFMVKFSNIQGGIQREKDNFWEEMIEDKNLIVINGSDQTVDKFIEEFVCRLVFRHKDAAKKCKTIIKELLRIPGNVQIISFLESYEYLWKTQQIPLVIQVDSESEIEEFSKIMKISQEVFRIMILNKNQELVVNNLKSSKVMNTFLDLSEEQREKLLAFPIKLQGRCLSGFNKFFPGISKLNVKDFIYILCNKFEIGKEFEALPDVFVNISLRRVWLKVEVLQEALDDVFIIYCEFMEDFKEFIESNDFDIEESEIISWPDMNEFNPDYHRIIFYDDEDNLKDIEAYFKTNREKPIHFLIFHNNFKLEWVNSWGTIKNLKEFRKPENLTEDGIMIDEFGKDFYTRTKPIIISSNPGMGKSVFVNYIARNAPTNFWVIKISLGKHKMVYKKFVNEPEFDFNLKEFFWEILECKDNLFLTKLIFSKFYESKNIVVLLDGFDEIPINYQNDAKKFIEFLNRSGYFVLITTRPVLKNNLEVLLDTFAINLNPFSRKDQEYFLQNYFIKFAEISCKNERANLFVENLLNVAQNNLNDRDNEFTGVPLQTLLLAEVFIEDFKKFLNTKTFINENFDLLYLYKTFIEKKVKIACDKFGDISEDMIHQYKICKSFYALRLIFSEEDLNELGIDLKLQVSKSVFPNMLELIQKDGIVVAETETNIRFIHQTFAEYLAGEWLTENIKNENKEIAKKLLKITFDPRLKVVRNIFDRILAKNCTLHLAVINFQMKEVASLIGSSHLDDLDDGNRSFLHLLASWGFQYPKKKYKKYELFNFRETSNEDKMIKILKLIPDDKLKNSKDQILGNTPIDYAILNFSLHIANILCQKLKNSQIHINVSNLLEPSLVPYCEDMNYLPLRREILNHINIDSELFIDKEDRNSLSFVISRGNIKKLNSIITKGINLNEQDKFGSTPLHIAVRLQKEEIVKILLQNGADKNIIDYSRNSPLHWSVIHGNLNISKLLISHGINLNLVDSHKRTALHHSIICRQHQKEIISELSKANLNLKDIYGMTPLLLAADYGYTQCVSFLLELGASVEQKDKDKMTALHYAAINGYIDMVELLLSKGADINSQTKSGSTPLIISERTGHTNIVNYLLNQGANIHTRDNRGKSALYWAAYSGNKEIVTLLINKQANIEDEVDVLHAAFQCGDKSVIDLLLSHGIDINLKDKEGRTALHWAAFIGHKDIIKLLLSRGAKLNATDNKGNTVIHWAVRGGHIHVVKILSSQIKIPNNSLHTAAKHGHKHLINLLLLKNADINFKDQYGMTPLHYAANDAHCHRETAALLLAKGADIESRNNKNEAPLILAAKRDLVEVVDLLLAEGANLETRTNENETPLIVSAKYGQNDVTIRLISKGAKIKAKDNEGKTALHWAASNPYTTPETMKLFLSKSLDFLELRTPKQETLLILAAQAGSLQIVRLLLSKNVDIEAKDCTGMNALHWLAFKGYKHTLYVLLEANADIEAKDNEGKTALIFAAQNGHDSVVDVLLSYDADVDVRDKNGSTALEWAEKNVHDKVVQLLKSI